MCACACVRVCCSRFIDDPTDGDSSDESDEDDGGAAAEVRRVERNEQFIDFVHSNRVFDVLFEHMHQQCFIQSCDLVV